MEAHWHYRNGHFEEAFVTYALLAELGYEVSQSNAAFILDKGTLCHHSISSYSFVFYFYFITNSRILPVIENCYALQNSCTNFKFNYR